MWTQVVPLAVAVGPCTVLLWPPVAVATGGFPPAIWTRVLAGPFVVGLPGLAFAVGFAFAAVGR